MGMAGEQRERAGVPGSKGGGAVAVEQRCMVATENCEFPTRPAIKRCKVI